MKALSSATPRVILVIGIPGAGKTYFAEKFSQAFDVPFIEADKIRRTIFADPSYSEEEQTIVDELCAYQLIELMKTKQTILFEGNTEDRADRQQIAKLVKAFGYEPLTVWVQTEPTTAYIRATRGVRGHSKALLINDYRYDYLETRFMMPTEAESPIVISGKHTSGAQIKAVLKRFAQFNRQSAPRISVTPPPRAATPVVQRPNNSTRIM